MKKNMKKIFTLGFLVACGLLQHTRVQAQADIHFSQFYETSILRNPALTGVFADDYKLGVYYRDQWSSISNPYRTTLVSAETRLLLSERSADFFSFGLLGYQDKAGSIDQKITAIYPAVNFNKSINPEHNSYLSVGFTGGYMQYSIDESKATFNNQYVGGSYNAANPNGENLPNPKMTLWDLGAGINYNTSSGEDNKVTYVIGVSAYHFTQPKLSYYRNPDVRMDMRLNGNMAVNLEVKENVSLQFQGNYAHQGTYQEIMVGGLVSWNALTQGSKSIFTLSGGVMYRYKDAVIPVIKMKYKALAVAVSYDVNLSTLQEASNEQGGYEMTVFFSGKYRSKYDSWGKTVCPRF